MHSMVAEKAPIYVCGLCYLRLTILQRPAAMWTFGTSVICMCACLRTRVSSVMSMDFYSIINSNLGSSNVEMAGRHVHLSRSFLKQISRAHMVQRTR